MDWIISLEVGGGGVGNVCPFGMSLSFYTQKGLTSGGGRVLQRTKIL